MCMHTHTCAHHTNMHTDMHTHTMYTHAPSLCIPACQAAQSRPSWECYEGTRKASHLDVPLQSTPRTPQTPRSAAPGFPALLPGLMRPLPSRGGQPPRALALSFLRPAQGGAHTRQLRRRSRKEAGQHDFISLGQADQLPPGPWPVIFSPEHVFVLVLFCFVLFSRLSYHVAVDPFSKSNGVVVVGVWCWEKLTFQDGIKEGR